MPHGRTVFRRRHDALTLSRYYYPSRNKSSIWIIPISLLQAMLPAATTDVHHILVLHEQDLRAAHCHREIMGCRQSR
jgi:hypothetical protein